MFVIFNLYNGKHYFSFLQIKTWPLFTYSLFTLFRHFIQISAVSCIGMVYMASFFNSRATRVLPPTVTIIEKIKRKQKKTSFTTDLNFFNVKTAWLYLFLFVRKTLYHFASNVVLNFFAYKQVSFLMQLLCLLRSYSYFFIEKKI